jgi:IS605 OrfB family transposase
LAGDFDAISLQQPGKGSTPCRCGAHERVANARSDFQHKLSRRLVDENQAICVETLNIKGMQKNRSLAKAISDASWYSLRTKIEYKAVCTSLSVEACVNRGTPPLRPSKQKA